MTGSVHDCALVRRLPSELTPDSTIFIWPMPPRSRSPGIRFWVRVLNGTEVRQISRTARSRLTLLVVAGVVGLLLAGCAGSAPDAPPSSTSVVTTVRTVTAPPSTVSSAPSSAPDPVVVETPAPEPETQAPQTPQKETTYTCGNPQLYQQGTAIYSDGTTGYEQACDVPGGTNPYGSNTRGDATPAPGSYVPGSGDGYGPNQPLPPLCLRFPQEYGPCP